MTTHDPEQLLKAIKLMNAQLVAGEGTDLQHYIRRAYPGEPAREDPALANFALELLDEIDKKDP